MNTAHIASSRVVFVQMSMHIWNINTVWLEKDNLKIKGVAHGIGRISTVSPKANNGDAWILTHTEEPAQVNITPLSFR